MSGRESPLTSDKIIEDWVCRDRRIFVGKLSSKKPFLFKANIFELSAKTISRYPSPFISPRAGVEKYVFAGRSFVHSISPVVSAAKMVFEPTEQRISLTPSLSISPATGEDIL